MKSIAAGALGGLAASLAMNQFQAAISAVSAARPSHRNWPEQQQTSGDDATVKAAQAIASSVFQHQLRADEKKWAGPAVHYALGTALGAVYGALAENSPVETGGGTAYGTAVWLCADEIAVPLLGFSSSPFQTPLTSHVNAWASHLVFGIVTHFTRKLALS